MIVTIASASLHHHHHHHLPHCRCRYCQIADRHHDMKMKKMRKDGGNKVERASTVVESDVSVDAAHPHGRRKRGHMGMVALPPLARGDDGNGSNTDREYDLERGARRRQRSPSHVAIVVGAYRAPFPRPPRVLCGGRHDPSRGLLESLRPRPRPPPSRRRYARVFRARVSFRRLVAGDGAARARPRGG
jgi:hypothetical protein